MKAPTMATLYPRHDDFVSVQERLDPRDAFRNEWLQSRAGGTRAGGWGAIPRRWRPSGPGHGAFTCLARIPVAPECFISVHVAARAS